MDETKVIRATAFIKTNAQKKAYKKLQSKLILAGISYSAWAIEQITKGEVRSEVRS